MPTELTDDEVFGSPVGGSAVAELSDVDVFGAAPTGNTAPVAELSDADVFGAPAAPARKSLTERLFAAQEKAGMTIDMGDMGPVVLKTSPETQAAAKEPGLTLPKTELRPEDNTLRKAGGAAWNTVAGFVEGATSPEGLEGLINPFVGVGQMAMMVPHLISTVREAAKTPANSPERWQAATDILGALSIPVAAHGATRLAGRNRPPTLTEQLFPEAAERPAGAPPSLTDRLFPEAPPDGVYKTSTGEFSIESNRPAIEQAPMAEVIAPEPTSPVAAEGQPGAVSAEAAQAKLRPGENQGDLLSTQTEDLTLVGEKGTDHAALQAETEAGAQRAEEARLKADYEQGLLDDFQEYQARGGDELLDAVESAGGLPAKSSPRSEVLSGELKNIREEIVSETGKQKYGFDYNKVFKADAPDLDTLTKHLRERGFDVETPNDTLSLIQDRLRGGKPTYGNEARMAAMEEASYGAAGRVEDFIPSEQALGITPFKGRTKDTLVAPAELKSSDPKVEARWKDATRTEASIWQRGKEAATAVKNEFTRADPNLDPKTDAPFIDAARRFRTIPRHSQELAANIMRGFTAGLGKNKFEVFQRNVILSDLVRDVDAGRYAGRDLPFGYTPESLKADASKFAELAKSNPAVAKSLETRNRFMGTLKKELVENGLLPEQIMKEGDYFHRQVVQYLNAKETFTTGTGSGDVRTHAKGFQRERTHSSKDYNTKYLEAEYEVISQALGQLRTVKALDEFRAADIKPSLMAEAKEKGADWKTLVPEDHTIWQPKEGNVFYQALTIPEKIIDGILNSDRDLFTRELSKTDLREVLAMGGAREQWVVPKRIAKTLDNIAPKMEEGAISGLARKATNGWKVWILLNPARSIKYGLNNLSGDLDISFAYSPKIASQYGPKAAKDMHRYVVKRGAITPEISEGIEKGVLSSGFSVAEVPDINAHQYFRVVSGENPSLIERGWQKNKDYHNWRENTLRLAAWRFFKDKMAGAKEGERFYAASRKSEIDGLYDAGAPSSDIAAKLARELIGDYGNISHAGSWIRSHALPFYSWMEINAPRYVRLLKNAASEGEGNVAPRAASVIAKKAVTAAVGKTAKTAVYAAGMYALVNIWNHTFFAKEEEELGEGRRQLHLILGRNEDGSIKSLRIQGALSDALSWVGGEDLPSDVADVRSGKETVADKAIDAVKAPPTKIISGVTPFVKTPVEALTRRSLFPDPFNPRPVRDPAETIAQMFSLEKPYRYFTDKPMRPVMNEIASLLTYTTDPGEAAYHMTRGLVANWQAKQGDEKSSIIPTARQNALFYHKKALQLGEPEKAERWKERYFKMGGAEKGLDQSIEASSPFGALSKRNRDDFFDSLSPKERAIAERAEEWYNATYDQ